MAKYHNTARGPRVCNAKPGNCPIKGEDGQEAQHFTDKDEAQAAYQKALEKKHGVTSVPLKKEGKAALRQRSGAVAMPAGETFRAAKSDLAAEGYQFQGATVGEAVEKMKKDYEAIGPGFSHKLMEQEANRAYATGPHRVRVDLDVTKEGKFYFVASNPGTPGTPPLDKLTPVEIQDNPNYNLDPEVYEDYEVEDSQYEDPKIYKYEVPKETEEKFRRALMKNDLSVNYRVSLDERYPQWAALPTREGAGVSQADVEAFSKVSSFEKAKTSTAILKASLAQEERNRTQYEALAKQKADLQEEESVLKASMSGADPLEQKKLNRRIQEVRRELKTLRGDAQRAVKPRYSKEELEKKKEELTVNQSRLPELEKEAKRATKEYAVKRLASHHPSQDAQERLAAAEAWIKSHPEILKDDKWRLDY